MLENKPVGVLRNIDSARFARSFCATCEVDSVAEQTVARHPVSNDPCHHFTGMDSNCYPLRAV
jgi:hypothetical protein